MKNITDAYLSMLNPCSINEVVNTDTSKVTTERALDKLNQDIAALKYYVDSKNNRVSWGGAGSGEVRILRMDDINPTAIGNGKMLIWDANQKKFTFIDLPSAVNINRTTTAITSNYSLTLSDYYVGVNSSNPITITLPVEVSTGKEYIIKDESGNSETFPIRILGTIDNDTDGAIIQTNNGSVTLLYRNGWRIV